MTKAGKVESIRYPAGTGTGSRYGNPKRRLIAPEEMLRSPADNNPNPYRETYRKAKA